MKKEEVFYSIEQFEKAFKRLSEIIKRPLDDIARDAGIQRFEFTFELMWKALKIYLGFMGRECKTPRDALKEAFKQGMLSGEDVFLRMLDDRNLSSHTYKESTAKEIFERIELEYVDAFKKLVSELKKRYNTL
ncbi:MAG: nucleotidyltransferase substrate binding protein [Deltaproteobacteria bacterium]|nr:nucleotidyltransferase substrate binding protein [Deltaproteobacteria bacterium]MBI2341940.1 nucleotidyltransferase substrate binding protein [Deltaproteobacteria bacterium]